jgi:uncharacterized membrane protein
MVSLDALLLTVALLVRQSRMSELAGHRAHLDLQINLPTEQKVARTLEMLDERGAGASSGQADDDFAKPANPAALPDAIKQSLKA